MLTVLENSDVLNERLVRELLYKNIEFNEPIFEQDVERAVIVCDCRRVGYQQKAIVTVSFKARYWVYNRGNVLNIYAVKIDNSVRSVEQGEKKGIEYIIDTWTDCRLYNIEADSALISNNQCNRVNDYAVSVKTATEELRKNLENIMLLVPETALSKNYDFRHLMTTNLEQLQGYASNALAVKKHNIYEEMDESRVTRKSKLSEYGKRIEGTVTLRIVEEKVDCRYE